jgi:phage protein D
MSLQRPSVHVTIGSRDLSAAEAGLVSLRIVLGRCSHDTAELVLWPRSKFASASSGDKMTIGLGYGGDEEDVWTGKVSSVEYTPDSVVIAGLGPTFALSQERKSQSYVSQKISQIVRDLAGSVDIEEAEADGELSYYAVDHQRSIWGHLLDLASLSGSDILTSASGGLRFIPQSSVGTNVEARMGRDLLHWRISTGAAGKARKFALHGAASEAGSEKWHWLNASSGDGAEVIGAFHTQELANGLGKASETRNQRAAVHGEAELTGRPTLRPGDALRLKDIEGDPGVLRVLSVCHTLRAGSGFRTHVRVEGGALGGIA